MDLRDALNWLAGGERQYMTLVHCMNHDTLWIAATVILDLTVASGYALIALHWRRNEALLKPSPAKNALRYMKNIFVFCGLCGYLFIPIKMFWPAWRLYDGFLIILAVYTWRYALGTRSTRVIYEELGRSEKLAEEIEVYREDSRRKSYFLNALSHDLKTPLNGMMLQAELAELDLQSDDRESLREALDEIKKCARKTDDLLNRFLEIGRLDWSVEPSRLSNVSLSTLLADMATSVRARAEQKGLQVLVSGELEQTIETDRVKLERILVNLLDNAVKFTHKGSIQLHAELAGDIVRIHVEDTGEGIDAEHQGLIFEEFIQVNNRERDSRKGFGLGLAIARRLARQIGGDLVVRSEAGRGSRFSVLLPAAEACPARV